MGRKGRMWEVDMGKEGTVMCVGRWGEKDKEGESMRGMGRVGRLSVEGGDSITCTGRKGWGSIGGMGRLGRLSVEGEIK